MITYSKDEIMTATDMVRNFSSVLGSLSSGENKRIVVVKNNRFEAVMITIEEYERIYEAVTILERIYDKNKKSIDG
ncbi:MAG: prevent-host-death protein [Sulfurospirillaceae bacterium]|nr:prevent-host-death protein [Sulfurospirillaceae bacterium]MDD3463075.1 prevent-host-death protein [Sulfurospirillaceae bacterium]